MNFPTVKCTIKMTSLINPSEDPEKIKQAITNIFLYSNFNHTENSIIFQSDDLSSLERIHETIHSKQSQKTYKRNLEKNLDGNKTWFYLNKQAAFVNKIAICENEDESPLGPIKVVLTSSQLERVIDWLVLNNKEI